MVRRRSRALAPRDIAPTGCPPTRTFPRLGSSKVPAMVSRVLLPEPLGPITATSSPWPTDRLTSCSAFTKALPSPYDLDTSRSSSRLIVVFSLPAGAVAAAHVVWLVNGCYGALGGAGLRRATGHTSASCSGPRYHCARRPLVRREPGDLRVTVGSWTSS